jgi:hypothetical protein
VWVDVQRPSASQTNIIVANTLIKTIFAKPIRILVEGGFVILKISLGAYAKGDRCVHAEGNS